MKSRDFLHSVAGEPVFQDPPPTAHSIEEPLHVEAPGIKPWDATYGGAAGEPALTGGQAWGRAWNDHVEEMARRTSPRVTAAVMLLMMIAAGPLAIFSVFAHGGAWNMLLYVVVFGPMVEEFFKQSGSIYLLEKKPWHVRAHWQLVLLAAAGALGFSAIENYLYIAQFDAAASRMTAPEFAAFRWAVCTPLHLGCALIGAMGMRRVWEKQRATGAPADISLAGPALVVAVIVHGAYNLMAVLFSKYF